jgi:hypothetical protein
VRQPVDADPMTVSFEVDERQIIEVLPGLAAQNPDRLIYVASKLPMQNYSGRTWPVTA